MSKQVLIIDDDEVLRYSMSRALSRYGYHIFESESMAASKMNFKR